MVSCSSGRQMLELDTLDDSLKLNGCYVMLTKTGWNYPYFIFKNGIIKTHGATKLSIDSMPYYLTDSSLKYDARYRSNFGIVKIFKDSIKVQLWPPGLRRPSIVEFGHVVSRVQFIIDQVCDVSSFGNLTNCEPRNDVYHFLHTDNKPDSINPFIER